MGNLLLIQLTRQLNEQFAIGDNRPLVVLTEKLYLLGKNFFS